jgi:hypothetical protein
MMPPLSSRTAHIGFFRLHIDLRRVAAASRPA